MQVKSIKKITEISAITNLLLTHYPNPDHYNKPIDEKYGSMDLYLKEAVGLTEEDIKNLQDKYLV